MFLIVVDSVGFMVRVVCLLVFFHHDDCYADLEVTIFHHGLWKCREFMHYAERYVDSLVIYFDDIHVAVVVGNFTIEFVEFAHSLDMF